MKLDPKNPKLIIVSAPSGAGKTTLCDGLLNTFSDQVILSISSTTRAPRGNEKHGVNYHFITEEEFKKKADSGGFAEWAKVHGHLYGTSRDVVNHALANGKYLLLDIDVQGADSLRKIYPQHNISIFIVPPSLAELERRLRDRKTESEDRIQRRISNARDEMKRQSEFDHILVNDDLDRALNELTHLLQSELGDGKRKQPGVR